MNKCEKCFHKNVCSRMVNYDSFWKQTNVEIDCKDFCEVSNDYNFMLSMFSDEFTATLEDMRHPFDEITDLVKKHDQDIIDNLKLFVKFSNNLRNHKLQIVK